MELNCRKEVIFKVCYNDIDNLISKIYGKEYRLVDDMEYHNDSCLEVDVKKDDKFTSIEKLNEEIEQWKYSKRHWMLHSLMRDLCIKGLVEEGKYIINISW